MRGVKLGNFPSTHFPLSVSHVRQQRTRNTREKRARPTDIPVRTQVGPRATPPRQSSRERERERKTGFTSGFLGRLPPHATAPPPLSLSLSLPSAPLLQKWPQDPSTALRSRRFYITPLGPIQCLRVCVYIMCCLKVAMCCWMIFRQYTKTRKCTNIG